MKGPHTVDGRQRMTSIGVGVSEEVNRPVASGAMEAEARIVWEVRDRARTQLRMKRA
jgi:hypothetical protein